MQIRGKKWLEIKGTSIALVTFGLLKRTYFIDGSLEQKVIKQRLMNNEC